ncbi:MAG: WYL domain-containing protein [Actinobacteria bacterium]|nr:WYL domain-containing protein [Actinomycetota bacterium]
MHPLERLLNLVALLLEAGRPLTFGEIRAKLPAYQQGDLPAAKRMFERDKDVLRENGIPVELYPTDPWEVEDGYLIPKDRYYLPEISFTPEEISALVVAAHTPGADGEAEQAVRKLQVGAESAPLAALSRSPITAGIDPGGPRLAAVAEAIEGRRAVRFSYRPARGEPGERHVDPWAIVWRSGHWYVAGLDRDRGEPRSFRLSRFLSDVSQEGEASSPPPGFDAKAQLRLGPWGTGQGLRRARVAFSPDVSWWATRGLPEAEVKRTRRDGWVEVALPAGDSTAFVSWVLSFGPDAELLSPRALREDLVARLEAARAAL